MQMRFLHLGGVAFLTSCDFVRQYPPLGTEVLSIFEEHVFCHAAVICHLNGIFDRAGPTFRLPPPSQPPPAQPPTSNAPQAPSSVSEYVTSLTMQMVKEFALSVNIYCEHRFAVGFQHQIVPCFVVFCNFHLSYSIYHMMVCFIGLHRLYNINRNRKHIPLVVVYLHILISGHIFWLQDEKGQPEGGRREKDRVQRCSKNWSRKG